MLRIAHRAYAGVGAENSLEAIERALALGCDLVEVDVRRRRDGALVLHHDSGDRPGVPLLTDALELIRASPAGVNLDVKQGETASAIVEAITISGMLGRVTCTGGAWAALARIHAAERGIRIGLTLPRRGSGLPRLVQRAGVPLARRRLTAAIPRLLAAHDADLVTVHHRLVDRRLVRVAHAAGADVWSWTVDDPREVARLAAAGVDGICSDLPRTHGLG